MIDFVNLRSEKYSEDSRIPVIVNYLFLFKRISEHHYKMLFEEISQSTVYFTTSTLKKFKILLNLESVTLKIKFLELLYVQHIFIKEPYETFKDDPLRVLRCFRFKARFDFNIH